MVTTFDVGFGYAFLTYHGEMKKYNVTVWWEVVTLREDYEDEFRKSLRDVEVDEPEGVNYSGAAINETIGDNAEADNDIIADVKENLDDQETEKRGDSVVEEDVYEKVIDDSDADKDENDDDSDKESANDEVDGGTNIKREDVKVKEERDEEDKGVLHYYIQNIINTKLLICRYVRST